MPPAKPPPALLRQQAINQARPQEVAEDAVRVAFNAIDTDRDERISLEDILEFVHSRRLNIRDDTIHDMFAEARRNLCCVPFAVDYDSPLRDRISPQDVFNEMTFRQKFPERTWVCKPFRDEWIFLVRACLPDDVNIFFPRLPDLPTDVVVRDTRERVEWETQQLRRSARRRTKRLASKPLPAGRSTLKTRADGLHDEGLLGVSTTKDGVNALLGSQHLAPAVAEPKLGAADVPVFTFAAQAGYNSVQAALDRASLYCKREKEASESLRRRAEDEERRLEEATRTPEFSTIFGSSGAAPASSAASLLGPPGTKPLPRVRGVVEAQHEGPFRVSAQRPPNNQTLKMEQAKDEAGLWGESVYARSNKPNIYEFREDFDPRTEGKPRFRLAV